MPASVPPIFCINRPQDADRRRRMERRFAHHGLADRVRWVEGVAPLATAGHMLALETMLADPQTAGGAVVCEDDVLLHDEFPRRLTEVIDNLPRDAPMCLLGHLTDPGDLRRRWAGLEPSRRNLVNLEFNTLCGTFMYWISPAWAREVLDDNRGIEPADLNPVSEAEVYSADGYVSIPPLVLEDAVKAHGPESLHVRGQTRWPYRDYAAAEAGDDYSPLAQVRTGPSSIALCMIVRDEAQVIGRCIESVRDLISTWIICDTGSADGTPDVIGEALESVPGELHHRPWLDFGTNRSELMALAVGSADYLLLLDADMTLEETGPLPALADDAYQLRHAGDLAYWIPRLVRGDRRWWFEGVTHEYLATEGEHTKARLGSLVVHHHGDGGSRGEKFARDAELLEAALRESPDDQRSTFYLAQTRRDQGDKATARDLYRRRVQLGGWIEEIYYAAFQAAALTAAEDPEAGLAALLAAWQLRPQRAEAVCEAARVCNEQGWHEAAFALAGRGIEIPLPQDDVLFVHRDVHDWRMELEYAIAAGEVGELSAAVTAADRVLATHFLPEAERERVQVRRDTYVERLRAAGPRRNGAVSMPRHAVPTLAALAPSLRLGELRLDVEPAWPQFNPSIAADGDGFRAVVRTSSYAMLEDGYRYFDSDGVARTLNYLVELDAGLELSGVAPLVDEGYGPPRHPGVHVEGFEDCRLFQVAGRWMCLANVGDRHPEGKLRVALLGLDGERISEVHVLEAPTPERHEKNWMPLVVGDELRIVYSCGPTVVLACDPNTGATEELARHTDVPPEAYGLRGNSQGIEVDGGFLFAIHECRDGDGGRTYMHRLVKLDSDFRLVEWSPPFSFTGHRVEWCAGLARAEESLILSFGVEDRAAVLAVVGEGEALELLEPVG